MPQFLVKKGKVSLNGKKYQKGDKVDLSQAVADRMPRGMLEPLAVKVKGEPVPVDPVESQPEEQQKEQKEPDYQGKAKSRR